MLFRSPAAEQIAVIATGAAKSTVEAECAQAAANVGAKAGVPVSPPAKAEAAPAVAITPAAAS